MILGNREEARLIMECITQDLSGVWSAVIPYVSRHDWRLIMDPGGRFVRSMPMAIVTSWLATPWSARVVASVIHPGTDTLSPLAKFLLTHFPGDRTVASSLYTTYSTGFWSGRWSSHLTEQIAQLEGWIRDKGASSPVGLWAQHLVLSLKQQISQVAQDEAEGRW